MFDPRFCVFLVLSSVILCCFCQDFAAEMTRQCLVPDPVGLVDCVESKVTLPYLALWVECTNSLGQNVRTSADIVNYRCKTVWEGKELIPEVFFIKDCVIEKTGLPAKNVSNEVLGAYKECENSPQPQQQRIKTAPVQQQQIKVSSVEYGPPTQQFQAPAAPPIQQFQAPVPRPPTQQFQAPVPRPPPQQFQAPVPRPPPQQFQTPVARVPPQPMQIQIPVQRIQAPVLSQPQNIAPRQQFQLPAQRPIQQVRVIAPLPIQQSPPRTFAPVQQTPGRPMQVIQQAPAALNQPAVPRTQMPPSTSRQPYSQQYFVIYPQAPLPNQQQNVNKPILSQKTASSPAFVPQQQIMASAQQAIPTNPNVPFSYTFQINHPLKATV